MEGGPLLADWWVELSKEFVPYLNIASNLPGAAEQDLLQRMGGRGWPHFVVLDERGERIVPGPALGGFRPFDRVRTIPALIGAQELIALRRQLAAEPESKVLAANLTLLEALLFDGKRDAARLAAARAQEGVDAALVARYSVQEVLEAYSREIAPLAKEDEAGRQAALVRAQQATVKIHRERGPILDTRLRVFGDYWRLVFAGALLEKDIALADEALQVYKRVFEGDPQLRSRLEKMAQELEAARAAAGSG
jgi:hypothetical protein